MHQKTFRPYDQDSLLLMPHTLHYWLDPAGLPAFISDLVDELDLRPFLAAHEEPRGMPPYHPAMMLKVLLYGYASGVRSSRRIEERLASDVGFMFLAGQARPDHKTIGEFRRRHLAAFSGLFLEVLVLCRRAGLVRLGRVALDGTKIKANASKNKAMSYARMPEREAPLEAEAKVRTGNPDAVPEPKAQRNFTDPESRMMRSRPDGWVQAYNVGAVVDDTAQVIVATVVTADPVDTRSLPGLVGQVIRNTGRSPRRLLADAGYCSDDNLAHLAGAGIDAYVAVARDHHGREAPAAPRGRIPAVVVTGDRH